MYMIYILEELQTQPSIVDINELKSIAVLLTSDGLQRPADDPVHFSFAYSGLNLSAMLSGERWLQSDCLNLPFLSDDQFFCCYSVLGCIPENFGNFWSEAFSCRMLFPWVLSCYGRYVSKADFGSGTDPISLLILFVVVVVVLLLLVGAMLFIKPSDSVLSNRIGMKFGRIVLKINTHQLTE